jgi:hypothetical protein
VGIKEVNDGFGLVSIMDFDLGYFDLEGLRFEWYAPLRLE